MESGLLHLHNFLRWVILFFLVLALVQAFGKKVSLKKTSLWLLIAAHTTLLIGLFQYFTGAVGYKLIQANGFAAVMKDSVTRFWAVEHMLGMIIAIVLITIARGKAKREGYSAAGWLYLIALIIILAVVPWPFREGIARPWFPGM
ncbi:MAG: hypothetical protein EOO07_07250 [Chitinophagaceae bacterium]|nr:MAG: hypothetical protein EOO07_07250 [Chitinophagaceae bacterium]